MNSWSMIENMPEIMECYGVMFFNGRSYICKTCLANLKIVERLSEEEMFIHLREHGIFRCGEMGRPPMGRLEKIAALLRELVTVSKEAE